MLPFEIAKHIKQVCDNNNKFMLYNKQNSKILFLLIT